MFKRKKEKVCEYIPVESIKDFFSFMNKSEIRYVLIKNISSELPNQLLNGKDIDIVVHEEDKVRFEKCMKNHGYHTHTPPLGIVNGWTFAYQLPEYEFWKLENKPFTLYIDASFKLACKSITPNVWIPLDNIIQEDIWKKRCFDEKNGWWIMDDQTILIYLFVRSIFDKHEFKQGYVEGIEERKYLLNDENTQEKLRKVFFKYTDRLIQMIESKRYDEIIQDYKTYLNY